MCVIDIFNKYAWVICLKDRKGITITNASQTNRRPNKIWVDKGSEPYNRSKKSWLQDNDKEMYSAHNETKSVAAERFMRTSKKIYKYKTSASKNECVY